MEHEPTGHEHKGHEGVKNSELYKQGFKDGEETAKKKQHHQYKDIDWKYTQGYRDGYDHAVKVHGATAPSDPKKGEGKTKGKDRK